MMTLLTAMGSVVVCWALLLGLLAGVGLLFRRALGLHTLRPADLLTAFWVGWCLSIAGLQLWQLGFRVNGVPLLGIGLAGGLGLWLSRGALGPLLRGVAARGRAEATLFLGLLLPMANRALGPPEHFDSGLYHLLTVRWLSAYPIVPGLGNLYSRHAFNNAYFLYVAMLDVGPWNNGAHHIANGVLAVALLLQVVGAVVGVGRLAWARWHQDAPPMGAGHSPGLGWPLFHLLLFPGIYPLALPALSSPAPDFPFFALSVVLIVQLLDCFRPRPRSLGEQRYALLCLALFTATGTTIRPTFALLGGAACLVAWFVLGRSSEGAGMPGSAPGARLPARHLWPVPLIVALLVLPWIGRSVVLSGYTIYPSAALPWPVDWRMPPEAVVAEAAWVQSWARLPGAHPSEVLGNWRWLGPWFRELLWSQGGLAVGLMVAAAVALWLFHWGRGHHRPLPIVGDEPPLVQPLFFLPLLLHGVVWFVTAPALRFALGTLWCLAAGLLVGAVERAPSRTLRWLLPGMLGLTLLLLAPLVRHHLLPPGPLAGFHPIPATPLQTFVTDSGLHLVHPRAGNQCWAGPLLCTPYPQKQLRLRQPDNLRAGFVLAPPVEGRGTAPSNSEESQISAILWGRPHRPWPRLAH